MGEIKKENLKEDLASLVDRMEKANAEHKELLRVQEELAARNILGGVTNAGVQPPAVPEISPKDYAKQVLEGKIKYVQ